jgi:organic radical activating enzyme
MDFKRLSIEKWNTDYTIQWRPLDMCNYDCSYCSPSNHLAINKKQIPKVDTLIEASIKLRNSIPIDKETMIVITGGEPFLIPNIDRWLKYLSDNNFHIMMFTNGSMPLKMYEKCRDTFSFKNLEMKISFHPETADIETIVNLAVMIKDAGGDVEIRAMLMKNLFHKVGQLEQELLKHNIPTVKLPVFPLYNKQTKTFNQPYESSRYLKGYKQSIGNDGYFTNEELIQLDNLKDNTQDYLPDVLLDDKRMPLSKFIAKGMNRFQGWQCEVVKRKLLIEADGRMKHGVCGNEGVIGNIFTDDVPPFKNTTTTCLQEQCHVAEEVMITKFYA